MIRFNSMLRRWSKELLASQLRGTLDPPPKSDDWLGYEGATQAEVGQLESRIGMHLPPSYKAFLRTTNGWRTTSPSIHRIRSAAEVDWFRVENEQWVETYNDTAFGDLPDLPDHEYFRYGEGAPDLFRARHLRTMLQISDVGDGVYLLNPEAVTPDGEWEAWFFANWIPGARRHASFAHMLLEEYRSFREQEKLPPLTHGLPRVEIPSPRIARRLAKRLHSPGSTARSLEELISGIQSADSNVRDQSLRTLFGKLRGRPRAERRPDLVKPLSDLFYQSRDPNVRAACVAALTELADDSPAPAPLLDALSDSHPEVVLQGIFALDYFPDRRAIEPLCRFVESDVPVLYRESAMSHLGHSGDPRAIPVLLKALQHPNHELEQTYATAGIALGRLGPPAVDALIEALRSPDARVRLAAVCGLHVAMDRRAIPYLRETMKDPDQGTRERAASAVTFLER